MDGNDSESGQSFDEESYYSESGETESEASDSESEETESKASDSESKESEASDSDSYTFRSNSSDSMSYAYDFKELNKIPTTVHRLETMASISVAIALWNRAKVEIPGMLTRNREWQSVVNGEVSKWIDTLPVPKSFAKCINIRFDRLRYDVNGWIYYHSTAVFFDERRKRDLYRYIDGIVWRLSDVNSVNFAETARNLLRSNKLTNVAKFSLACTYCLREEVLKIWPTIQWYDIDVDIFFYPVILYWKYYCVGKLDELTRGNIDEFMIRRASINWAAIEYFFDHLNAQQQVAETISLIAECGVQFQELLLLKLNETQRLEVLMKKGTDIVLNYAHDDFYGEKTEKCIAIWHEIRDLITPEQFVSFFSDLLENHPKTLVLAEIWNTVPHDFKRHILNDDDYNFIKKLFHWFSIQDERGLTFVSSVFSDSASEDIKKKITKEQFFYEQCINFIALPFYTGKVNILDNLMELFLPEAAESTEFKRSLVENPYFSERCKKFVNSRNIQPFVKLLDFSLSTNGPSWTQSLREILSGYLQHCLKCYATGDLETLNYSMNPFMSSYAEIVSEHKKNFLFSDEGLRICAVHHLGSKNNILQKIIADGVPTNMIPEFKRKLIFSSKAIVKLKHLIAIGQSSTVKKLINWCLQSGKARKKLKKQLKIV